MKLLKEKRLLIIIRDVRIGTSNKEFDSIGMESTSKYTNELVKRDTLRIRAGG